MARCPNRVRDPERRSDPGLVYTIPMSRECGHVGYAARAPLECKLGAAQPRIQQIRNPAQTFAWAGFEYCPFGGDGGI